ncbi:MAG: metal-dependent hydrolase [Gammaproteobacteria bacterium]|nr:metal-dependent hydrolase [Gammaproteobacteria bacterium]
MDSITQATLGAAIGVAVLARQRPLWQAALTGAVIGTLPDLDVFIDKGDVVNDMVLHRAETHAFFWQLLASFPIAYLLSLATRSSGLFKHWWLMTILVLFTHSMLDALTIYGTRLALPFSDHPFGLGSLFIIDPLYTLPLLVGLMLSAVKTNTNRLRWNHLGLILSTVYAGWAIGAQTYVTQQVMNTPEAGELTESQVLVIPSPFNTVLWRIILRHEDSYSEGFYSLLDPITRPGGSIRFTRYKQDAELEAATKDFEKANQIRYFSKGFYSLSDDGRYVSITDLRMGQEPYYVFSFRIAEHASPLNQIKPQQISTRMPFGPALNWLKQRALGEDLMPPE